MSRFSCLSAIWCAISFSLVAASAQLDPAVRVRTPLGTSESNVVKAIRRELGTAALSKRDQDFKVNTTLDKSWDGAVLLQLDRNHTFKQANASVSAGVEVVCTTCYITGFASGELTIPTTFNATGTIDQVMADAEDDFDELTNMTATYLEQYFHDAWDAVKAQVESDFDTDRFEDITQQIKDDLMPPPFNGNLSLNIPAINETNLHFSFDGLELYMLMDTTLSLGATYTLNLYQSEGLMGFNVSDLDIGVTFSIDLILDVTGEIDISSGFHIALDHLALDIALFSDDVASISHDGSRFEFLPVTIESADVTLSATLRVGIHAGIDVSSPKDLAIFDDTISLPSVGGGIDVGVYANVAEFVTNITAQPTNASCELAVVQYYQLAVGATAGATVTYSTHTWGPMPATTIPIWYTQLDATCVTPVSPTPTAAPNMTVSAVQRRRQDMITTTISTTAKYVGVSCLSSGLVNCPASLQNTSLSIATSTLVTTVPVGSSATFPATTYDTVSTTVPFGKLAVNMPATTGSPSSYTPPPPTTTGKINVPSRVANVLEDVDNKTVIGLSAGLGVPLLVCLVAIVILMQQKRKGYAAVPKGEAFMSVAEPFGLGYDPGSLQKPSKAAGYSVMEVQERDV